MFLRLFQKKHKPNVAELQHLVEQSTLVGAISDAVLAVDTLGAPLFYNSRFAMIFGDEGIGSRRIWKLFQDPLILSAFQKALKEGQPGELQSIPFEEAAGRRFFSVTISSLYDESRCIYGAIGVFHDVTDLKRAEQVRIDFVANVSHELRTPLTAIKGYADTLIQDVEQGRPTEKKFLEVIIKNTARLMSLIDDLLDLSAIESTDVLQKSNLNTKDVTLRVLKQLQGALEAKQQRVLLECRAKIVSADLGRLEQVLINLLDNASKYTPEGSRISILWDVLGSEAVLLKISDTGPGIALEHQSRLFERFYRVDKSRSRELGGTGLGLSIVKHIMQRHGGSIWVESGPGRGATFICKFPQY
jgi:two-component system, OmpR family, phosphate regulon sensor histidine kinase PhoR